MRPQRYIKAFFERYAGVRRYLDTLVHEARQTGAVRTLMGRRRLVRDILRQEPRDPVGRRAHRPEHAHPGQRRGHHEDAP